jgi:hypothetical protein
LAIDAAGSSASFASSGFDDDSARRALVAVRAVPGSGDAFESLGLPFLGDAALAV